MPHDDISDKMALHNDTDGSDKATKTDITDLKVEFAEEQNGHMSLGDVLKGTAAHSLTPFERKAALINE